MPDAANTSDLPAPPASPVPPLPGRADVIDAARATAAADSHALGRLASSPADIPWLGWKRVMMRTWREIISDRVSLVAAGCAFYATLALFPAISMLISLYGLMFDPATVEPQLATLQDLLPPSAFQLISERVHMLVAKPPGTLTLGLLISTGVALWSSATGTKSIISALNLAYEERERRSFLRFQLIAFVMTLIALVGAVLGLGFIVGLPPALAALGYEGNTAVLVRIASLILLVAFVLGSLSLLYRFGPCRRAARWVWITPGSILATVLWVLASALFSFYVGHLATYDVTYGPLGAVVGVMMWFFVTVYVVLLGAELNAELELQTAHDSTDGPPQPIGSRGAYVADHVARR
jgi:membrane protein